MNPKYILINTNFNFKYSLAEKNQIVYFLRIEYKERI